MKIYFVRKAFNREVVGLFVAPSLLKLASLVDECCDPTLCEYTPAREGGLMAAGVTASTWPLRAGETAPGLEDAVFSQQWENDLGHSDAKLKWTSLAPAARALLRALDRKPRDAESMATDDRPTRHKRQPRGRPTDQ